MILYAVIVGRLYYAGARDGQSVWAEDREECKAFRTYDEAERLRNKWTKTGRKAHPLADVINVVLYLAE